MRTSRKKDFRSSKNNFHGHDISQGLDREPPSLCPHFLLVGPETYNSSQVSTQYWVSGGGGGRGAAAHTAQ